MKPSWFRNGFVYLVILIALAMMFLNIFPSQSKRPSIPINEVAINIKTGLVKKIVVDGDALIIEQAVEPKQVLSRKDHAADLTQILRNLGVTEEELAKINIEYTKPSDLGNWMALIGSFLPLIIFGGLIFFMMRQAQSGNNQAISFGKSRARRIAGDRPTVTFDDVAGVEEAKQELQEVVEFLKQPKKFAALGARIPKGALLVGPPGTGKTLMARAVAGEAGVPFFNISGSEFVEMFVGVGASRVRDLFSQAKRNAPCIVFIDEIDAVGRHRGAGLGGSHDEREQTLNQILVEMDGFDTNTNVIILAATNRPDILDPALLRPGRFDRRIVLNRPDLMGRKAILEVHVKGKPLASEVDLMTIAKETPGFSGADIENLVNEAAILAARRDKKAIGMEEMQEALERVVAGAERKSLLISAEEKKILAYHEAGHALVQSMLPHSDPVHKISIIARGMALGYTMALPKDDRYLASTAKFKDDIAGLLGGRVAEELVFGDVTTGASNDLEQATRLARKMVTEYGMSDKLGPLTYGHKEELVFLGREIGEQRNYSEEVAKRIDEEIHHIITEAHDRAMEVLSNNRGKLDRVAQRLIEKETLDAEEFEALLKEEELEVELA